MSDFVGQGEDGTPVVSGEWMFRLISEAGFPFELARIELKERGMAFSVPGFVDAARKGGWTDKRILAALQPDMPPEALAVLNWYLARQ